MALVDLEQWRTLQLGMGGEDVRTWQVQLRVWGYRLEADGIFGKRTHNATVSWQSERGLERDGVVGPKTRQAINTLAAANVRRVLDHRSVPVVEAANWSRHIPATPKLWIVLHTMEAPEASTTANNVAEWFAGRRGEAPRASAHYCIDDRKVVCCVPPDRIAWHAPGANRYGIGLEHAGFARQRKDEWADSFSRRMIALSVVLAAQLCRRFRIPPLYCAARDLRLRSGGITTHAEVSRAWGKSDHTDPGTSFPIGSYIARVRELLC